MSVREFGDRLREVRRPIVGAGMSIGWGSGLNK